MENLCKVVLSGEDRCRDVHKYKPIMEFSFGSAFVLDESDAPIFQSLCERCDDVSMQLTGTHPEANAAQKMLAEVKVHGTTDVRGLCIGIFNHGQEMIGVLAVRQNSPSKGDWYIGSFMFAPTSRSHGYGGETVRVFHDYVRQLGGRRIVLSVMTSNPRARQFWGRYGYATVRLIGPIQFGVLKQSGVELALILANQLPIAYQ